MSLIEAVAAALLVFGSFLVILAIWAADAALAPPAREEEARLRKAA